MGMFGYRESVIHSTTQVSPRRRLCLLAQLSDMRVEGPALNLGDLEFEGSRLARTIGTSESASTPRRAL